MEERVFIYLASTTLNQNMNIITTIVFGFIIWAKNKYKKYEFTWVQTFFFNWLAAAGAISGTRSMFFEFSVSLHS